MINFKNIKAVVFDMDGLMADTEYYHCQSFLKLMPEYGVKLNDEYLSKLVGLDAEGNFKIIKNDFELKEDVKVLIAKREKIYLDLVENSNLKPAEGLRDIFKLVQERQWIKAVGSSSIKQEVDLVLGLILKALEIKEKHDKYFDAVVTGNDVKNKKPDTEIYLKVMEKINIKPENCLVLEDSGSGVEAAKNARMNCIAVRNVYTKSHNLSRADFVMDSLLQVNNLLKDA